MQLCIALGLLALLIYQAGLFDVAGRQRLYDTLSQANVGLLLISLGIGVVINMASAFKWWMLLKSQNVIVAYWRLFSYYLVGQFYNQVLPTSVGGDVVRSYELGKFTGRKAEALASVFVERYTGVLVLLLISGAAVLAQFSRFNSAYIYLSLAAFTVSLSLIAWLVLDLRAYDWVKVQIIRISSKFVGVFSKLDKLLASISAYRDVPSALLLAFANSFLFYFIAVLNVFITAQVFERSVNFTDMLLATPVIMLLMNLPISLGNLFLMEASYTGVFVLMGYSPALGLSVAITMRLKSLFDGMMGGLLHPFFVTKKYE